MTTLAGLWPFSLDVYSRSNVAPACLRLQDRRGIDVNLLLHALWCGTLGHRILPEERKHLNEVVAGWHENTVKPLRQVRRWMKHNLASLGVEGIVLREVIKKQELEAERLEQRLLEATLAPSPAVGGPAEAAANLLGVVPLPTAEEREDLVVLLSALWPDAEQRQLEVLLKQL